MKEDERMAETKTGLKVAGGKDAEMDKKPKREPKYQPDAKITLLKDKEGATYGPDNNPKRAGTESANRFALYKNGMTVKDALDAGVRSADIDWDVKHEFIKVA